MQNDGAIFVNLDYCFKKHSLEKLSQDFISGGKNVSENVRSHCNVHILHLFLIFNSYNFIEYDALMLSDT